VGDVAPVEDVILHEEEGEAFLLHVPTGRYFGLNRTGLVVWKALVAGEDPVAALARRWPGVAAEERRADAAGLVEALLGAGLARPAASPPPAGG
jgi:hypothetical protein